MAKANESSFFSTHKGDVVQGMKGLSSILNAFSSQSAMKHISKHNKNIAKMQYQYNEKEVKRAFGTNLKALMREQVNDRIGAVKEAEQMLSSINLQTSNNKNVESESFENDIKDKVQSEISDNIAFMVDNEKLSLDALVNTKVAQQYNIGMNYDNMLSSINMRRINANKQATQQMVKGVEDIGMAVLGGMR